MLFAINVFRGDTFIGFSCSHGDLDRAKETAKRTIGARDDLRYEIMADGALVYSGNENAGRHNIPAAMIDEARALFPHVYDDGDKIRVYFSDWEYAQEHTARTAAELAALIDDAREADSIE